MTFPFPGLRDAAYRLWRLKRLIAFCLIPTFLALVITGLPGVGVVSSFAGLAYALAIVAALVALHVVMFPNAYSETMALSLVVGAGFLLAPLFGGSAFLWFLFGIFAIWVWMSGQIRILMWSGATKPHQPEFRSSVRTSADIETARNWFPLRPGLERGAYRCGAANADGVFAVWHDPGTPDFQEVLGIDVSADLAEVDQPDNPPTFHAVIDEEGDDFQRTRLLEGDRPDSPVQAVVETRFKARRAGCVVTECETPTAFPWGQSLTLWLNDFAKDGLVQSRDLLEGRETLALRAAHQGSLLQLFGGWFMWRMMKRAGGSAGHVASGEVEIDDARLAALLERLGPDFMSKGYTNAPFVPLTLEEFFEGNGDAGSFQGGDLSTVHAGLLAMRARDDVADIRIGVTQWEGPGSWPLGEYIYVVTTGSEAEVGTWMKDAGVWVGEIGEDGEHHVREPMDVPEGYRTIWVWID